MRDKAEKLQSDFQLPSVLSSSRRRHTGRSSSTDHTEERCSYCPPQGCRTRKQWLMGTRTTLSPPYLQGVKRNSVTLRHKSIKAGGGRGQIPSSTTQSSVQYVFLFKSASGQFLILFGCLWKWYAKRKLVESTCVPLPLQPSVTTVVSATPVRVCLGLSSGRYIHQNFRWTHISVCPTIYCPPVC